MSQITSHISVTDTQVTDKAKDRVLLEVRPRTVTELVNEEIYLTAKDVMSIFKFARSTFARLRKAGKFPKARYVSRRPLWITKEVLEWGLKEGKVDYFSSEKNNKAS